MQIWTTKSALSIETFELQSLQNIFTFAENLRRRNPAITSRWSISDLYFPTWLSMLRIEIKEIKVAQSHCIGIHLSFQGILILRR